MSYIITLIKWFMTKEPQPNTQALRIIWENK